jgi:hypothetical protein
MLDKRAFQKIQKVNEEWKKFDFKQARVRKSKLKV